MERDNFSYIIPIQKKNFNSHAHVERDENVVDMGKQILDFNSHAHVERDDSERQYIVNMLHFNSHAHVERDSLRFSKCAISLDFNSHAHVERDGCIGYFSLIITISTHTLTWSVTHKPLHYYHHVLFQLTRSRGA